MALVSFDPDGGVSFGDPRLRRSRTFRHAVGAELDAAAARAFAEQRSPKGDPWRARSVPNVAGLLEDLAGGRPPQAKRFRDRPALVDTGALARSVGYRLEAGRVVPVAAVPYARLHAEGGTSTITVDTTTRRAALRWLASTRQPKAVRARVAAAVAEDVLTIRVPARPFLGADAKARRRIRALAARAATT